MLDGGQVTSGSKVGKNEEEVFEFPWVVFDVESKQVVDEKQVSPSRPPAIWRQTQSFTHLIFLFPILLWFARHEVPCHTPSLPPH